MIKIKTSALVLTCLGTLTAGQVLAHTTVLKKNTPDGWAERIELEGTSTVSATTISHGCSFNGSPTKKVTAQAVVWPNGEYAIAVDGDGNEVILAEEIIGNAVIGPKPIQDHNIFKKIKVKTGTVPEYNNHGLKNSDIRGFEYTKGKLDTNLLGVVPYSAGYPKFRSDSCATKLKIQFAIANYCTKSKNDNDRADIWMGEMTPKFNDPDVVSVDFWPHVNVMRDMVNNPVDEGKCGDGYEIVVTPSAEAIDKFLPIKKYWPAN